MVTTREEILQAQTNAEIESLKKEAWVQEYSDAYLGATHHAFILTGDVYGLTTSGQRTQLILEAMLALHRIVLVYNPARGFSFLQEPKMRLRACQLLQNVAPTQSQSSLARGLNNANTEETVDPFARTSKPLDALRLIEVLILKPKARGQVAVIIEQADLLCPNAEMKGTMSADDRAVLGILCSWGRDVRIQGADAPIFLMCSNIEELHKDLRSTNSGLKAIDIPLPDRDARLAFLTRYLDKRAHPEPRADGTSNEPKSIPLLDLSIEELANITAGVNLTQLENILLLAYMSKPRGVTRELVSTQRQKIIETEYSEIASIVEPLEGGFAALGGMQKLVNWAQGDIINPFRTGSREIVKGALLVGPPGTGKTLFARALAKEAGVNMVALKSENILSKWVGESERKLRDFFRLVNLLCPCIVFMDELDQSDMSNRGGDDHPVARNLFNQMLQEMSDETRRGQVIYIFASNRPDRIDSALLRFGRMDAIIPVLLPEKDARAEIIAVQARRFLHIEISSEAIEFGAEHADRYSSADLAAVVAKAKKLTQRAGRQSIEEGDIIRAMGLIRPNTPQIADRYTRLAVRACNDKEWVPEGYEDWLDDLGGLDQQIRQDEGLYTPNKFDRSL